ncbi:MAG: hypothetical protein HQK55_18925 [Deltaproteobacteria bacterium]|nr:hypothetical protein [Deltaproteobacteria bacterium]
MPEVTPGIYLELKETNIGTGVTARKEQFRNFWMTLSQTGEEVVVALLDGDFNLTGVRQTFNNADFESGQLKYIPQGDKKYQILLSKLEQIVKSSPPKPASTPPAATPSKPAAAKWWESTPKDVKPGDIFKRDDAVKKGQQPKSENKKNWWE